jgi:hypothetical protein
LDDYVSDLAKRFPYNCGMKKSNHFPNDGMASNLLRKADIAITLRSPTTTELVLQPYYDEDLNWSVREPGCSSSAKPSYLSIRGSLLES